MAILRRLYLGGFAAAAVAVVSSPSSSSSSSVVADILSFFGSGWLGLVGSIGIGEVLSKIWGESGFEFWGLTKP